MNEETNNTTIEQDLEGIVQKLRTEREMLQNRIAADTAKVERLTRGIEALENPAPAAVPKGPTVFDMAFAAVEQMHNGATFDHQSLRDKMTTLYPAEAERIKTGVYNAVATLQKRNKIERAPGGFRAVRPIIAQ